MSSVELIVASALMLVVLGALVQSFVSQLNSQTLSVSRSDSAQEVIPGLERMTRDIRSATYVNVVSASQIDLQTPIHGGATVSLTKRVYYDCSTGKCTRDEGAEGLSSTLSGSPKTVIDRLQNTDVFTPTSGTFTSGTVATSPYVGIKLNVQISPPSGRYVRYEDGVTLRNVPTS